MADEIERKWIATLGSEYAKLIRGSSVHTIEQFYTTITDETEIRLRHQDGDYFQTTKTGNGISRTETEVKISASAYEGAKPHQIGNMIRKKRTKVPLEDVTIEIDGYELPRSPPNMVVVEIEFPSVEVAQAFAFASAIPKLAFTDVREVTDDKRYKNKTLAKNGFPN